MQDRIAENVRLIKSIVTHSADEVAKLVQESMATGMRAEDLAKRIEHVGEVSKSRARTIAATEVSKAGTALTRARAESVGSEGYIWRTARDGAVRDSHRMMEGKFVRWDSPPTLDGMTGHAGEFPNCRCYPEPVIPRTDTRKTFAPALPTKSDEDAYGVRPLLSEWERGLTGQVVRYEPAHPLPNAERAVIAPPKAKYCLDPVRGKGRLFEGVLGIRPGDEDYLKDRLWEAVRNYGAVRNKEPSERGEKFVVIAPMRGRNGRTVEVKSVWMYKNVEGKNERNLLPELITAYPNV